MPIDRRTWRFKPNKGAEQEQKREPDDAGRDSDKDIDKPLSNLQTPHEEGLTYSERQGSPNINRLHAQTWHAEQVWNDRHVRKSADVVVEKMCQLRATHAGNGNYGPFDL